MKSAQLNRIMLTTFTNQNNLKERKGKKISAEISRTRKAYYAVVLLPQTPDAALFVQMCGKESPFLFKPI